MMWIGLTGGIASGKTAAQQELVRLGYPVVDADQLARQVVAPNSPGYRQVVQTFGQEIVSPSGEIDRKKLAAVVFSDSRKLSLLEKILHPLIGDESRKQKEALAAQGYAVAFYAVPLLFEKSLADRFDRTLLISCDREVQLQRLMKRDGIDRDSAEKIVAAQWPLEKKAALADTVIDNNGSLEKLKEKIIDYCHSIPRPR